MHGFNISQNSLHINNGKTKIMRMHHAIRSSVTVAVQPLNEVNSFTYLGSMVAAQCATNGCEVKNRQSANCLPDSEERLEFPRE